MSSRVIIGAVLFSLLARASPIVKRSEVGAWVVPTEEYVDCSDLSGLDKAECMNNNFDNGFYLGSADSCNDGEIACTPDHEFAVCDYGKWVVTECAAGTSCYAFNFHGVEEVTVRCHFTDDMDKYEDDDKNKNEDEDEEVQPLNRLKRSPLVSQAAAGQHDEPEHVELEGYVDCSGLSGSEKAECINKNFDNGFLLGSALSERR